jgi:hypothetical protein
MNSPEMPRIRWKENRNTEGMEYPKINRVIMTKGAIYRYGDIRLVRMLCNIEGDYQSAFKNAMIFYGISHTNFVKVKQFC